MRFDCNGVQSLQDYRCPTNRISATGALWSAGSVPGFAPFAAAQDLGMAGRAHGFDHFENALAHPRLADLVVGAQGLALDQRVLFLLERRAGLAETFAQ
jgi:hypothetical protein